MSYEKRIKALGYIEEICFVLKEVKSKVQWRDFETTEIKQIHETLQKIAKIIEDEIVQQGLHF